MKKRLAGLGACVFLGVAVASATGADCACKPTGGGDLTGKWSYIWDTSKINRALLIPEGPPPVFTAEYKEKSKKIHALGKSIEKTASAEPEDAGSVLVQRETGCLPYGMPVIMRAAYSIEIFQTPQDVAIIGEAMFEVRRIYLNEPQAPLSDVDIGYEGHSVGHWEGHTLVVNTIGIKESVLGYNDMPHSDKMVLDERIRLLTPDLLQDRITITDPVALLKPYHVTYTLLRRKDLETPEYVCDNEREKVDSHGKIYLDVGDSHK